MIIGVGADLSDIRLFRQLNPFPLPADLDGQPTWNNLLADLRQCGLGSPAIMVVGDVVTGVREALRAPALADQSA